MDAEVLTIKGEKFALLPLKTWEKLQNYLDELQDIADCNEIKACIERGEGEYFPAKVVDALIDGENPVKTYRGYRGLTQAELAEKAGLSVALPISLSTLCSLFSITALAALRIHSVER